MTYKLEIFPEAEEAINKAVKYWEGHTSGRGSDLLVAISEAIDFIYEFPEATQIRYKNFRAKPVKRFPYILVIITNDLLLVS